VQALTIRQQFDNASLSQLNANLVRLQSAPAASSATPPAPGSPPPNNAQAPTNAAVITALQARIAAVQARVSLDQQLVGIAQGQANPTIVAPFSGTVGTISINANYRARADHPVLDILDLSTIKVTASFPVADVASLNNGAPATLEFGDIGDVTLKGSVISVSAQANSGGQDVQVIAQAPNVSGQLIRAGLSAFVRVADTTSAPVAVNKLAVLDATDVPLAFVVTRGVAHVHKLVLGVSDGQYYEIKSGLSAGDQCVIVGNNGLSDGAKVRVAETQR
jgi:RND family efflux transporter MFP subunit